jgi:GNAT superfamily N-acetyltransferase
MLRKIIFTLRNLKAVAYHHYGPHPSSLFTFVYYSLFRINTFVVFECDLTAPLPELELEPGFRVLKPPLDELERIRRGKDLPREFYSDQFHHAQTCYLALRGDEIAYIHWVYVRDGSSRFLRLRPGAAEINYITTLPPFRGQRLSSRMLAYTVRDLKGDGYTRVAVVVHEYTSSLIRNLREAGFRETARLKSLGPLNRRRTI